MDHKISNPVSALNEGAGAEPAVDNLRIVVHVVDRIRGNIPVSIPMEFLTSIGILGLSHAELSYRAGEPIGAISPSGISFQCYAKSFIRGFILDSIRCTPRATLDLMQMAIGLSRDHDQRQTSVDNQASRTSPVSRLARLPSRS